MTLDSWPLQSSADSLTGISGVSPLKVVCGHTSAMIPSRKPQSIQEEDTCFQNFQEGGPSAAACPSSVSFGQSAVCDRGHVEGNASCTPTREGRVPAGSAGTTLNQASPGTALTGRTVEGLWRLQTVAWGWRGGSLKGDSSPELSGHVCRAGL